MMWAKLDEVYDRLIDKTSEVPEQDRGVAAGIALCIAIVEDPYRQDIGRIRLKAKERRSEREAEAATATQDD